MKKIEKGQISLEAIIIIGVIVLASIIFATFYISNVNKKIDSTTNLDPNFSNLVGNDEMGSIDPIEIGGGSGPGGPGGSTCGDGIKNGAEECDGSDFGGDTCSTQGFTSGSLSCTGSCTIDTSGCLGSPTTTFTITSSTGPNGAINPLGATTVNLGASKTFYFIPNPNYVLDSLVVDGSVRAPSVRSSHTFNNVQSNHTIHVTFKPMSNNTVFNILATAGSHGSISPSGDNEVLEGEDISFTFTPDTGYRVGNVLIDSITIGSDEIEIINNFSANNSQEDTLYFSEDVLFFGSNNGGGISSNNNYTFENVTEDHTIHVTFIPISTPTYTLEYLAGVNGSISGPTSQTVNQGNDGVQVCAVGDTGYDFLKWDDGGNNACRQETNVTSNQTYTASFKDAAGQTIDMTLSGALSSLVNQSFNITVDTSATPGTVRYGLIAKIYLNNTLTNNCSFNGTAASTHTLETNGVPGVKNYSFSCSTLGSYKFTLTATDVSLATNTVSKDHLIAIENNTPIEPPVFTPNGGTFYNDTSVTISSPTSGVTIRYTTDNTTPTCTSSASYSSAIQLAQESTWIKAVACKSGSSSEVTSKNFKLKVANPTPNVPAGNYASPQTITLSTITNGATIYYSLDDSDPYIDGNVYDGTSIKITNPYTILKTIAVRSNYSDSSEMVYYYFINGYTSPTPTVLFRTIVGNSFVSLGNKNLTHSSAELIDSENNLVKFEDPKLDGNYFDGSNSSGNNEIDCNLFCSEKYPGGVCEEYETTSFSGNGNYLIFSQSLAGDGTPYNNSLNSFPHTVKGIFSKSTIWRYGSGVIGGPDRIESFTCDFSHTPSPYDNGSIDLYNMPILTNDYEVANRLYFPSIEVTFDDVLKNNNQYTYTNVNVVGEFGGYGPPINSPASGEMVYINSDNFQEACSAVCESITPGSSCVSQTTDTKYGSRAIVYKYVSGLFSDYFPNGYYWHVPSNGFLTLQTEPVLSQVTCQVS